MSNFFLGSGIKKEKLAKCYFFFGEETFLVRQFIDDLKEILIPSDDQDFMVDKFRLDESSWMDVIDTARTIPLLFSSTRIITVDVPFVKGDAVKSVEKNILKDYFSSPSPKTVFVILLSGKVKKSMALVRFFSSLPSDAVHVEQIKPLKDNPLSLWINNKIRWTGKSLTDEAKKKLVEMTGNDLGRINNELEKLITYVGEKKNIDLDDVDQVSALVKTFAEWEIKNSLEESNYKNAMIILNRLIDKEGIKSEYILFLAASFFRDIFQAKLWLKEKKKDEKAVFKEFKPHILERFGSFYKKNFQKYFLLVNSITFKDLNFLLTKLENIDLKIKTTDVSSKIMLEGFLFEYFRCRKSNRSLHARI